MKVLVTGGSGFLGLALCRALRARGDTVVSLQRHHSKALDALDVTQVLGALDDAEAVRRAVAGADAVLHNAAKASGWGAWDDFYRTNVTGTGVLLAEARAAGIRRFVYTSTPSVVHAGRRAVAGGNEIDTPYGTRFSAHYPHTKMLAERAVLAADAPDFATVALRPRLIWGPGDTQLLPRLAERARAGRLRFIGDGGNRMDCTYVDNVVQAHLQALDALAPGAACAGKAYFISNAEPKPIREIVNGLLAAAGAPWPRIRNRSSSSSGRSINKGAACTACASPSCKGLSVGIKAGGVRGADGKDIGSIVISSRLALRLCHAGSGDSRACDNASSAHARRRLPPHQRALTQSNAQSAQNPQLAQCPAPVSTKHQKRG